MWAERKRLGRRVQEVQTDTAAHGHAVDRPAILGEDAQVVIQIVLPPRGGRVEIDERWHERAVRQLIDRVPNAAGRVVVVTAPEVAALHLEPDLGVVRARHVARRGVYGLARQPIVEVKSRWGAIREPGGLIDD